VAEGWVESWVPPVVASTETVVLAGTEMATNCIDITLDQSQ